MSELSVQIRKLSEVDAPAFQALRLLGLRESPTSFGSSFEEERDQPLNDVQAQLSNSGLAAFYGAFQDSDLVGIVGVWREPRVKKRHVAFLRSLYVDPAARGLGTGKRLLEAAMRHAWSWEGVDHIALTVTAQNASAVNLYLSRGFAAAARTPRALRLENAYLDELFMVCIANDR